MLFSAHIADTSPLTALRRKTPNASSAPGLRSARTGICTPFSKGFLSRPQLGREVMVACWEDEVALDRFLEDNPMGADLAKGWHVRMELVRAVGVWPGLTDDMAAVAGDAALSHDGPSVAITIGTAYAKSIVPFARVNNGLEDQFLETPSGLWGTAMANVPRRLVATLTVWQNLDAAADYMKSGAHGAAVKNHFDFAKDPTGHTFVTGGGFFGFRPLSSTGEVSGKNAVNAGLLAL